MLERTIRAALVHSAYGHAGRAGLQMLSMQPWHLLGMPLLLCMPCYLPGSTLLLDIPLC